MWYYHPNSVVIIGKILKKYLGREWGSGSVNNRNVYKNDLKEYRITIQVSEKEKEKLKILAKKEGLTISTYLRKIAIYDKWREFFNEY